jgi:hypothetical protein
MQEARVTIRAIAPQNFFDSAVANFFGVMLVTTRTPETMRPVRRRGRPASHSQRIE